MSSGIRSSLERLALVSNSTEPELVVLKRRAFTERGIAVVDLGKIRNKDWPFAQWLREETQRQLGLERKEARS